MRGRHTLARAAAAAAAAACLHPVLLLAGEAGADPGGSPVLGVAGIWAVCDKLEPGPGFPSGQGFWCGLGVSSWESLPGSGEIRIRAGYEPRRGAGFEIGASRLATGGGGDARDWSAGLLVRSDRFRVSARMIDEGLGRSGQWRVGARGLVVLHAAVLAGVKIDAFPAARERTIVAVPEVRFREGPWLASVLAGDSLEISVGVVAGPAWTVFVRHRAGVPAVGVSYTAAPVAFQAETADHPFLGRTARAGLRLGAVP